jgi:hypothetical protein
MGIYDCDLLHLALLSRSLDAHLFMHKEADSHGASTGNNVQFIA